LEINNIVDFDVIILKCLADKVTRVMIKPNNDDVEGGGPVPIAVGEFITCNVSARPPAEITWYKMSGNGPVKVTKPSGIDNFSKVRCATERSSYDNRR